MANTKIPCAVGMLAWNSASTISRTLGSVKDFAQIIVADGGSEDGTIEEAKKYGATIIPQSRQGKPIEDYSLERNKILEKVSQPWFLWLDSDELISTELHEEIRKVCSSDDLPFLAYKLRIARCDPNTLEPYLDLKDNYQIRLIRADKGFRYMWPVHERFNIDQNTLNVGVLKGAWLVPVWRTDFADHKKVVNKRFKKLIHLSPTTTFRYFFRDGVLRPLMQSIKIITRIILLRILHPTGKVVPFFLERNRLYTQWVIMRETWIKLLEDIQGKRI